MDYRAQTIKNRLSLRKPQADSLEILNKLIEVLDLAKGADPATELAKVRKLYPTCTDFERDFPSVCFALATGVGKTRLMGAFISYLYTSKGIKNFFVLAPNLTIYEKLKTDLSEPNDPKYVFRGIAEFTSTPPRIITGDNYNEARQATFFTSEVHINIFNISKINSEVRGGREPKIKRLSEYIGESYFSYLSSLPDLVLLMDESHHYRADAGLKAINELRPILGLELTATPIDTKGAKFKNVVFDYPLALALRDGFVKEPAVATRKDFNPDQYKKDPKELDLIKLEDGMRIHESTKTNLEIYARNNDKRIVRPFVLVVTRDTDHAKEIHAMIESNRFFDGRYHGKVMEIHSSLRGEEKEENVQKLLALEDPDNQIEIVVHVNMLKEGWDVTNLYTIIPLRAANAQILAEQTIGRGLRLPYGIRTGVDKVDKLTIIAHDRFQAIIDAANNPSSIIRKENIIEIDPEEYLGLQEVVTAVSTIDENLANRRKAANGLASEADKARELESIQAHAELIDTVSALGSQVANFGDLRSGEARKLIIKTTTDRIKGEPQQDLFREQLLEKITQDIDSVVEEFIDKTIPIPRTVIEQAREVNCGFNNFDLNVDGLNYQPVSEEIVVKTLGREAIDYIQAKESGIIRDTPVNIIVNELINYSEIEYDRESDLLYKLAGQALSKLGDKRSDAGLRNIVLYHKRDIGAYIYAQLSKHFYLENTGFEKTAIYPFTKIERHNYSKYTADSVYHYMETIVPTHSIPSKVFIGFKKAYHNQYKFDSKAEKDFAAILEQDSDVVKWLRPAEAQFSIYWKHNSRRYTPDFIVEMRESIYMVEVKAETDIDDDDVQDKAKAGNRYCDVVTEYNSKNDGKQWKYSLIPHTAVTLSRSALGLLEGNVLRKF